MKSDNKAKDYIQRKKVFPLRNSPYTEVWLIEGTSLWEVRIDKRKSYYSCSCPNVRLTDCCHIKAVKIYKQKHGL